MSASGPSRPESHDAVDLDLLVDDLGRDVEWGRWGADDGLGTLNYVTDDRRFEATRNVRSGQMLSLALPLQGVWPQVPGRAPQRTARDGRRAPTRWHREPLPAIPTMSSRCPCMPIHTGMRFRTCFIGGGCSMTSAQRS